MIKKRKPKNGTNGYGGQPARIFSLPLHHYTLPVSKFHRLGILEELRLGPAGFQLLRCPDGQPVARRHNDLQPGEISLVLR